MHLDKAGNLILGLGDEKAVETIGRAIEYENAPHFFENVPKNQTDNRHFLATTAALLEAGVELSDIDVDELQPIPLRDRLQAYERRMEAMRLYVDRNRYYSSIGMSVPTDGELDPVVAIKSDELEDVKAALEKSTERFIPSARNATSFAWLLSHIELLQDQPDSAPVQS